MTVKKSRKKFNIETFSLFNLRRDDMFKKFIFSFTVLATSFCFAHDSSFDLDDNTVMKIVANEKDCVQEYVDKKIYLKPGKILPTEYGLYLNLNDKDYLPLSALASDIHGCYVSARGDPIGFAKCSECGQIYRIKCTNPNCSRSK